MNQPVCPECQSDPGVATASLAPTQAVCPNEECPVVSWRQDRRLSPEVWGSYLPAETDAECRDCGTSLGAGYLCDDCDDVEVLDGGAA